MRSLIALIIATLALSACGHRNVNRTPDLTERMRLNNVAFEQLKQDCIDWNTRFKSNQQDELSIIASFTDEQLDYYAKMEQAKTTPEFMLYVRKLHDSFNTSNIQVPPTFEEAEKEYQKATREHFEDFYKRHLSLLEEREHLVNRARSIEQTARALDTEAQLARQKRSERARAAAAFQNSYQAAQQNQKLDQMNRTLNYMNTILMNPGIKVAPPPVIR